MKFFLQTIFLGLDRVFHCSFPPSKSLEVTKDDYTFATTTAPDGPHPYGVSDYCGYHDGANYYQWSYFKINLTGTGFKIHDSVSFMCRGVRVSASRGRFELT